MRHLIVGLALLLLGTGWSIGQPWTIKPLVPEATRLHSVHMRSEISGVAVGDSGLLRRAQWMSTDTDLRRLLWSAEQLGTAALHDVVLLPSGGFVAVGEGGSVWRATADDGAAERISTPTTEDLLGVACRADVLVACGTSGTLLRSTNGGRTWTYHDVPTVEDVLDICVDGQGQWTAITSKLVMRSADGITWTTVDKIVSSATMHRITTAQRIGFADWMLLRLGDPWMYEGSTDGGRTWMELLPTASQLRAQFPRASALSLAVSATLQQHSLMFYDATTGTPFHWVTFDYGLSWTDLCTQFFNEFVGTAQHMITDTTLISTALGGGTLTFNRIGTGAQQRWVAPESITTAFEPLIAIKTQHGPTIAGHSAVVDASQDHQQISYSLYDQALRIRDVDVWDGREVLLADSTWSTLDGVNVVDHFQPRLYLRADRSQPWQRVATLPSDLPSRSIASGTVLALLPMGKTVVWMDDPAGPPLTTVLSDTSWWSTGIGALSANQRLWLQVITLAQPDRAQAVITQDAGGSWTPVADPPFQAVCAITTDEGTMIISGYERRSPGMLTVKAARSTDLGQSWEVVLSEPVPTARFNGLPLVHRSGRTLLITPISVLLSDSDGTTWAEVADLPLSDDAELTTGHWTSDTSAAFYTRQGDVITGPLSRFVTSVAEASTAVDVHLVGDALLVPVAVDWAIAADLSGRVRHLSVRHGTPCQVPLGDLSAGVWVVTFRTPYGVQSTRVLR